MAVSTPCRAVSLRHTFVRSLRASLLTLLLALPITPLMAQITCPMAIQGGNGQSTFAGTRFSVPLTVGQNGATSPMPNPFTINWSVDPPGTGPSLYFLQNFFTNYSSSVNWNTVSPFSFSDSVDIVAPAGATGVHTIRAQTGTCSTADSTFNVNVITPSSPSINLYQGSGQSAVTGSAFSTSLGVFVGNGSPTPAPVANAKVSYQVLSGPATFASNGEPGVEDFTDGTGHLLVALVADSGVTTATPVVIQVDSLGVSATYSNIMVVPAGVIITASPNTTSTYSAVQSTQFADLFNIRVQDSGGTAIAGEPVTFTLSGSTGASLSNGGTPAGTSFSGVTNANGDLGINVVAGSPGTFGLAVSTSAGPAANWNLQTTPAGANTVTASPSTSGTYTALENAQFSDLFKVRITDASNTAVAGEPVTFTLSGSTGATLMKSGNPFGTTHSGVTDSNGEMGINVVAGTAGTFALNVSTSAGPASTWNLQTLGSSSQVLSVVSGNGQTAATNAEFGEQLVVEALASGVPSAGVAVTFNITGGTAHFMSGQGTPTQTRTFVTDNAGRARVTIYAGNQVGGVSVDAVADAFSTTSFNLQVGAADPDVVVKISGDNQQGQVNAVLARPLVAGVTPQAFQNGNGAPLSFEVLSGGARFVQSGTSTYTAVPSGPELSAAVDLQLGSQTGPVQVRVSFPGMISTVFTANGVAGGGGALLLIKTAGDGQVATTSLRSDPLRVRLSSGSTPIVDGDIDWMIVSGDATLVESHTKTDANGDSQTSLDIGSSGGPIVVRAVASAGSGDSVPLTTTEFSLSSEDARLTAVAGSGQVGAIGSDADQVFTFELRRANGSLLPGQTISFSADRGATVSPASAVTGADGRASTGVRYGTQSGVVKVSARAFGGRIEALGNANTFVPILSIAAGNNQSAAAGAELPNPLVIAITQPVSLGKGLQGARVQWTVVSGGGTIGSATTTTDAQGRSSNTLRLGQSVGTQQVRASIAEVGEVVFTATATVPANSVLEIVSGNDQAVVPQRPSDPLVVRLRTSTGTALSGFTVHFTPSSGATVTATDVVTALDGRASTVVSVTLPGDYTVTASLPAQSSITPVVFRLGNGIANIPGLSGPADEIAHAIDVACPQLASMSNLSAAQQDLLARCSELVVNADDNTDDVVGALDQMLADETSAQNNAALASASAQFENLKGRLAALRSGAQGANLGGLALLTSTGRLPLSFLPSNLLMKAAEDEPAGGAPASSRWGFFATGTIGNGNRDAGDVDPGGDFDNYGLTAGIDYRITRSLVLGAALGFNRNDSQLNGRLGDLESRGYSASAYATWFHDNNYYADAVLTVGRNSTDVTRRINYSIPSLTATTTVIDQIAYGSPDSDQQSLALSFGKDFNRGAWSFGPYLRGTYTRLDFDGYVERMSDPSGPGAGLALAVDGRALNSMQGVLGGKLSYAMSTSWGILLPSAQIEYVKEFEDDADGLVTRFAFDPTQTSIVIDGDEVDSDFLNIGIGLSAVFANGRSGYLYYEHVAGKDRISQGSLAIGVRIEF